MSFDLTLNKEGSKWAFRDGKDRYILTDFDIPATLDQSPVEDYTLDEKGRFVTSIVILDLEEKPQEFRPRQRNVNPKFEGPAQHPSNRNPAQGTDRRQGQDRNQQSRKDKDKHKARKDEENKWRFENPAFAPYNFVPLNQEIVISDKGERNCSGYLEVVLTAKTPFFIGNENPSMMDERQRQQAKPFFRMLNGPMVPGTALRGLTRTMVEIVSWSAMAPDLFSNKKLSFRALAEQTGRLKDAYQAVIPGNRDITQVKAGYLVYEAESRTYHVLQAATVDRFDSTDDARFPEWNGSSCFVRSGKMPGRKLDGKGGKKRQWKLSAASKGNPMEVPHHVITTYRDDSTRDKRFDVFKAAKEAREDVAKFGYPVFFNTDASGEVITSIGHTGYYRVPYAKSIGDHIRQAPLAAGEDFAHSIFGTTDRAGRVWFEDCLPVASTVVAMNATHTQMLLGPKATTFQHYLLQPNGIRTRSEDLLHWGDEGAPIRGHKLYWHRGTSADPLIPHSWAMRKVSNSPALGTDQAMIQPLKPGAQFKGKIRFDNLTAAELGAMLFALDLPKDCCHKMGYAKPLGLGSIRVTVGLTLIDRVARYTQLWNDPKNWNQATADVDPAHYKLAFAQSAGKQLGFSVNAWEDLWTHDRLAEMRLMLTFNPTEIGKSTWLEATRYMRNKAGNAGGDNEYRLRPVLPKPSEVMDLHRRKGGSKQ